MPMLARIPVWVWYIFSVAFCYATWNPYASLWQLMQGDHDASAKALALTAWLIVAGFYLVEGHRNFNVFGILMFIAAVGAVLWFAFDRGFRAFDTMHLWLHFIIAAFMTLATQGGRIRRYLTGVVPVQADSDHHGHHS